MKNSGKGAKLPEGSFSSDEDIKMSLPAKSMVNELRTWMDTRIQERLEAFNENVQSEPPMVKKDDTTQLLLQILNDQNSIMKKLEQTLSNTEQFTKNIATLVQGISQGNITKGIELGQGFGHNGENQPQIEIVATNVEIPIGYPVNPGVRPEERPNHTNLNILRTEPPRVEPPQFEQPRTEPPKVERPRFKPPRVEPPRVKQPRTEPPRVEPPRFELPKMKPLRVEPTQFEPPRMEPPRVEPPRFEQPRMEPPCFGQPQFEHPRMEPFQQRIGQPEAGFRFKQPQRFGPIRNEPYREQFRF